MQAQDDPGDRSASVALPLSFSSLATALSFTFTFWPAHCQYHLSPEPHAWSHMLTASYSDYHDDALLCEKEAAE